MALYILCVESVSQSDVRYLSMYGRVPNFGYVVDIL